jgi:hypothetical protein
MTISLVTWPISSSTSLNRIAAALDGATNWAFDRRHVGRDRGTFGTRIAEHLDLARSGVIEAWRRITSS